MKEHKNYIIVGAILVVLVIGFVITNSILLQRTLTEVVTQRDSQRLGNSYDLEITESAPATTTVTSLTPVVGGPISVFVATVTPLTVYNLQDAQSLVLNLQVDASTTASAIYILPEVSYNNIDWYTVGVNFTHGHVSTGGNEQADVHMPQASTTVIEFGPAKVGISRSTYTFYNVVARQMRFSVWGSNGSSTVWMQSVKKAPF